VIDFAAIEAVALVRAGGEVALAARLPEVKSADALRAVSDDSYLSLMALRTFRAGLKHSLVDAKWPAFEEVFHAFEPHRVRALSDEQLETLMADTRLIRHWGKIKAVRANAAAVLDVAAERGGFGSYLADWPVDSIVELWDDLARRFHHMGGNSGPSFLRMAGKDTFLLTDAVVRALDHWGVLHDRPRTRGDRSRVQGQFNAWRTETGRPLAHLSMMLALSVA
jgi:3-methyladenine DNA glycosylase Tag